MKIDISKKLPRDFYLNDTLTVVRKLLGKIFVRKTDKTILAAKIVETEAYIGAVDESAHSFNGETKRNSVMFREGGRLYVYFTYGMYYCANVVTEKKGTGNAVLFRAMEPLEGADLFALNRFGKTELSEKEKINLLNGPAKICMAFGIDKEKNGVDLLGDEIFILDAPPVKKNEIAVSERIGISKSKELPWRFYIADSKFISRR